MLRRRSIEIAQQQRSQRRALIVFAIAVLVLLSFCAVVGLRMLVAPTKLIPAGRVEEYVDDQPRRFSVPKLQISSLISRRDTLNTEDVIFVRRDGDSWMALLGVDTLSGCFLYWDAASGLYTDNNCLGSRYTPDGRYHGGLMTGEQPQDMARLPVEMHDGQVFVRDELERGR